MTYGGVFDGPNSLGVFTHVEAVGASGDGGGLAIPCVGQDFVKAIQLKLVSLGYKIPVDGMWTQCTASAWMKENNNQPLAHKDQVKQFLGVECSSGYVEPSGVLAFGPWNTTVPYCTDGSDTKSGGGTTTPPSGDCLSKCASMGFGQEAWQCVQDCTGVKVPPLATPPGIGPGTTPPTTTPPAKQPPPATTSSFGTYALVAAGIVAVGAIAYYATKKKPAVPALRQNRRRYVRNCKYC